MAGACGPHDTCSPMVSRLSILSRVRRQVCLCMVTCTRRAVLNEAEFRDHSEAAEKHEAREVA